MTAPDSSLFDYSHLPEHLLAVSREFYNVADYIERRLPAGVERDMTLRKLLESKDCAVRAVLLGNRYATDRDLHEPPPTIAEDVVRILRRLEGKTIRGGDLEENLGVPFDLIEPHLALLIVQGKVLQVSEDPQTDFTDLRASELTLPAADD